MKNKKTIISTLLFISLLCQAITVYPQQVGFGTAIITDSIEQDANEVYKSLLRQAHDDASLELLKKLFGGDAEAATNAMGANPEQLYRSVNSTASTRSGEWLEEEIAKRKEQSKKSPVVAHGTKTLPVKRPGRRTAPGRKLGFVGPARLDWRQLAFGFQPLSRQQNEKPDVKMTETDKEIKAEGTDKKNFETKEAKGTRTQKAETRYTKDGKTFGMEINDEQIIEAVSKPDGKSFRKEISILWGAEVAACPDANGVTAGTGKAKVLSKTIYVENGVKVTMTSEFDLQAKLTGRVNDQAEMTDYDLQLDAYTTNSGYEDALRRNVIKEIKIKDGRYGIHYDITSNTIEVSDGQYGGKRTPAKMGKATGRALTSMSNAEATLIDKAIGPMVPSIWNSANEMYKSAQRNWQNGGCIEVACKVPKTTLEDGEEVAISAETVHLQDKTKVNAQLNAEGFLGQATPEIQRAAPTGRVTFTQEGDKDSMIEIKSISKCGIGEATIEFKVKKEKEEDSTEAGVWTGTITAKREHREERDKRSGANLEENGGYATTTTNVQLRLTGQLDRTVEATNAHIANVTGVQEMVDFEYDRYKVDEGYCGPNAVPYKGPKQITRTSTTTASYNKDARVFVEIGGTSGSLTFSLPEITGRTVHKYVHKSPCAAHDRVNSNEAIDEEAPTTDVSFSFSFPVDPAQKVVKGTITITEEDGSTTTYSWELTRQGK
jgi:hypothetical protein